MTWKMAKISQHEKFPQVELTLKTNSNLTFSPTARLNSRRKPPFQSQPQIALQHLLAFQEFFPSHFPTRILGSVCKRSKLVFCRL